MITYDKAVKQLEKEYEHAKKLNHIDNPLAYALYKVWRTVDSDYKKGKNKNETE